MNKQKRPALSLSKGFTLIELIVTIAVIAILSGVILFSVTQYISRGKDSNISGSLVVLIPAGEQYYYVGNSYDGFCDPTKATGSTFKNVISQMPDNPNGSCYSPSNTPTANPKGVCCSVALNGKAWAACARKFADTNSAYCVDSRGFKKEITNGQCLSYISTNFRCPD